MRSMSVRSGIQSQMTTATRSITGISLLLLMSAACSSGNSSGGTGGSSPGTGGSVGTGGSSTGGSQATGGSGPGTGGNSSTGGSQGTGTGGAQPGTGGNNPGTGGSSHTGGSNGTGGSNPGTGGSAGGAPGTGGSAPAAATVVTSANGNWWVTGTLATSTGSATVTVNDTGTKQAWEGMGGAFNELGWQQIQKLSTSDQTKIISMLFGPDGANFQIGRIPIGASDYATTRYTDDETANDSGSLPGFSITQDMKYLIPYVKAAQQANSKVRLWASPWTPPTWMKTTSGSANGNSCALVGSTMFDGGCMNASTGNLTAYATYFSNWVSAYKGQGITIDTVAPQNEPDYAEGYPSCLWNPADLAKFVGQYLGPAMNTAGVKVMLGTNSNGDSGKDDAVITAIEGDSTAKTFPKMIGLQWGMLGNFESTPSNYTKYNIPIWATEHKCGNYPWNPTGTGANGCGLVSCPSYVDSAAPNDMSYGQESWGYIQQAIAAGVTSYNAWNMVLDGVGKGNDTKRSWAQDSLITVMPSSCKGQTMGGFCLTPAYFAFRHVSAFAPAGGTVLSTSGGSALAFKNADGSEVVVMYNSGSANTAYTVAIAGKKYSFSMPAGPSWATVFVPAGS